MMYQLSYFLHRKSSVTIGSETLKIEKLVIIHVKKPKLFLFLGNIGGQLGLFIGCSFLTFIELLECIFMSAVYHYKRIKWRRQQRMKEYHPNPNAPDDPIAGNNYPNTNGGYLSGYEPNNYYSAYGNNNDTPPNGFPPPPPV